MQGHSESHTDERQSLTMTSGMRITLFHSLGNGDEYRLGFTNRGITLNAVCVIRGRGEDFRKARHRPDGYIGGLLGIRRVLRLDSRSRALIERRTTANALERCANR